MPRAAVALGGNAVMPGADATFDEQMATVRDTVDQLAALRAEGYDFLCTHGNGPQVGNRLLEQECADTPAMPLDILVAETQAQLGAMLQRALDAALDEDFLTIVTQTVVDPDDPAFDDPTKPIGPRYTREEAEAKAFPTARVADGPDGEARYRRVVASPEPQSVVESEEIAALVERGQGVICGGGGGVPVVRGGWDDGGRPVDGERDGEKDHEKHEADADDRTLTGVPAVVDKDYTTRLLADAVGADDLVFLTDVERVYLDYGSDDAEPLDAVDAATMREHLAAGEFGAGSMRPKVEAALRFLESGGERAIVCLPDELAAAVDGEAGTRITRG
ncbi:MAG: carbamate kinase [Haloferacaceae archaeon]